MAERIDSLHVLAVMAAADGSLDEEERALLGVYCARWGLEEGHLRSVLLRIETGDKVLALPKPVPERLELFQALLHVAVAGGAVASSQGKLLAAVGGKARLSPEERQAQAQAALQARQARGAGLPPELAAPPPASPQASPQPQAARPTSSRRTRTRTPLDPPSALGRVEEPAAAEAAFSPAFLGAIGVAALVCWVLIPLALGSAKGQQEAEAFEERGQRQLSGAQREGARKAGALRRKQGDLEDDLRQIPPRLAALREAREGAQRKLAQAEAELERVQGARAQAAARLQEVEGRGAATQRALAQRKLEFSRAFRSGR